MADNFVRIPPDSTGKRIFHTERYVIELTSPNTTNLNLAKRGDTVTDVDSGNTATFIGWDSELDGTILYVTERTGDFTVGSSVTTTDGSLGTINITPTDLYLPMVTLASPDTPYLRQRIDGDGAAYVRFEEGRFQFTAGGSAKTSGVTLIDQHIFSYVDETDRYYDLEAVGGSISLNPTGSYLSLSTTGVSGSRATRTSNLYYPYKAGVGREAIFSIQYNDTGKANNVRSFGMFDLKDGVFFRLDENGLNCVIRSSAAGGARVEQVVNQADWNQTTLTNAATDRFVLDVTKFNLYWIDYLWLGVGRVRFGVYGPDGSRIVCHVFENSNSNVLPYMTRGTLPVRFGNFNQGTTSGPSETKVACIAIIDQIEDSKIIGREFTSISSRTAVSGSDFVPLMSIRPALTFGGEINRTTFIPTSIEMIVDGDPIRSEYQLFGALTGSSFTTVSPYSAYEIDTSATDVNGALSTFGAQFFGSGVSDRTFDENFDDALQLSGDGVTQPLLTLTCKCENPAGTADVTALVRWKELK